MTAEDRFRDEIAKCRRCEACRELVDSACLVFPKMFSLADEKRDSDEKITSSELIGLAGLCNLCGICPCRDIRSAILDFKTEYADQHGLKFSVRVIEGVERLAKLGGTFPKLTNALMDYGTTRGVVQTLLGIHHERRFPRFPKQSFDRWWRDHCTASTRKKISKRKVAYFIGCTARYLFPDVARATVEVYEKNGVEILIPEQQCCGMPTLLEGDRKLTSKLVWDNVERWNDIVDQGYGIICSCPTCGYMLKVAISAGAEEHKLNRLLNASDGDFVDWPARESLLAYVHPGVRGTLQIPKKYLEKIVERTNYFAAVDPSKRLRIAQNTYDAGEYLLKMHQANELNTSFEKSEIEAVYYPPCHMREQRIDSAYQNLLNLIPGFQMASINGNYCCGNAGIMGFKKEFYHNSLKIAGRLIAAIRKRDPDLLTTECLSCRLQFHHLTPYTVMHPIEIIREAYVH